MTATPPKASYGFMIAGFACLVLGSYLDNIRGPLMPTVALDLSLDHSASGLILAASYVAAAAFTGLLLAALNRWTERRVALIASFSVVLVALSAPFARSFASVIALSCVTGATISILGTMSNVLVLEGTPESWRGRVLAGLHAMFGLGSMIGATTVAAHAAGGEHWSSLYAVAMIPGVALGTFSWFYLRHRPRAGAAPTQQATRLSRRHISVIALFGLYVVGEVMISMWLPSYLIATHRYSVADAAECQLGYFLTLTLARLAAVLLGSPHRDRWILSAALGLPLIAFALGRALDARLFVFIGLYGPFFPVLLARASRTYPDRWRTITIWTIVGTNVLLAFASTGLGKLAAKIGIELAFYFPPLLLIAALLSLWVYFLRVEPKVGAEGSAGSP